MTIHQRMKDVTEKVIVSHTQINRRMQQICGYTFGTRGRKREKIGDAG